MKKYYLNMADENLPEIKISRIENIAEAAIMNTGDTLVLDLGNHYVGHFSFKMWHTDIYIDAPVKMAVRFMEVERELEDDYSDYRAWLCRSWLQEEIINVDFPGEYRMPRRYAARYIKITILATPKKLSLSDFVFEAQTSADVSALAPSDVRDEELAAIDKTAINTLKNCMQRVFEDGPKRDRRLWIGDLRLEALANYYTFGSRELVKRCLYLFAAADKNELGFMPGFVYENPIFESGTWFLIDYSMMYVCALCDYFRYTGDTQTFRELYPVAKSLMDAMASVTDEKGLAAVDADDVFIDWCEGLKKRTALCGVYLYTLEIWCDALEAVGDGELAIYKKLLDDVRGVARKNLYDEQRNAFINEADEQQYSVQATAWMILGGVIEGEVAKDAMLSALASSDSIKPFTPYMHHYVTEALIRAGAVDEAEKYIRSIWGEMLKYGDTFAEVYAAGDPDFSPYGDRKVNSMCHAWSCTPTYFIRKYKLGK